MATSFGGGTGTETDPYLITNASELAYFMKSAPVRIPAETSIYEGCYFLQTADIDMNCHDAVAKDEYLIDSYTLDYQYYETIYWGGETWQETANYYNNQWRDVLKVYTVLELIEYGEDERWVDDETSYEGGYMEYFEYCYCNVQVEVYGSQYWAPIQIQAHYDGGGHTVADLIVKNGSSYSGNNSAFWSHMRVGSSLKNLTIDTISFGGGGSLSAAGGLVGEGYGSIENCHVYNFQSSSGLNSPYYIGGLAGKFTGTIKDCSVNDCEGFYTAGAVGYLNGDAENIITQNVTINWPESTYLTPTSDNPMGGIFGILNGTAINCLSNTNFNLAPLDYSIGTISSVGGVVGYCEEATVSKCSYHGELIYNVVSNQTSLQINIGGIIGGWGYQRVAGSGNTYYTYTINKPVILSENYFAGSIQVVHTHSQCYVGGIVGYSAHTECEENGCTITNNLANGIINFSATDYNQFIYCGGFIGYANQLGKQGNCYNNIGNSAFTATSANVTERDNFGGFYGYDNGTSTTHMYYAYNEAKVTFTNVGINNTYGTISDDAMKDPITFVNWTDFDNYWIIDENINYGYPMLRAHLSKANITGFDGSGTESDPYQIKTTADLQGMQAYYNDYQLIDEYWWILINDIDISVDANGLTINWCPIGYEGGVVSGFNGHFDGNGKTISGLTITEQYENVGLFGRLSNNATITNLNVTGTINWDQGKYVGGVVGLLEDGATLTGCTFNGTITGYLNSGNIAVVGGLAGKYGADAITGIANYDCYVYGADNYTTFNRFSSTYAVA